MSTFTLENINLLNFTDGTNAGAGVCSVAGGMSVNGFITSTGVSAGTLRLNSGSITDLSTAIDFGATTLTTSGGITGGALDSDGTISAVGEISGAAINAGAGGALGINLTSVNETELRVLSGATAGTAVADKALVVDNNVDITGLRNVTATGNFTGSLAVNQLNSTSLGTSTVLFSDGTGSAGGVSGFRLVAGTNMTSIAIDSSAGDITFNASGGGGGGGATDINGLADAATNPTSVTLGFEDAALGTRSVLVGISPGFNSTQADSVLIGFNPANNTGTMTEVIAIGTDAIGSGNFSHGQTVSIGTSTLFALAGNTTGNTAVGHEAGSAVTTGGSNTFIGNQSGNTVTTGSNVTCLGNGSTASADNATNEVTLGNGTVTTLRCATSTIASVSDVRDKTEIEDLQYGLNFLDNIRPVEFTWDRRPLHPGDLTNPTNGTRKAGFIAQELLESMPNGENEILDLVTESNPERIEAKYASLIPVMVKAIKDLKSEVQELRYRVDNM